MGFTSVRVALQKPELFESGLVLSYRNHFPGKLGVQRQPRKEQPDVALQRVWYGRLYLSLKTSSVALLFALTYALIYVGGLPDTVQRIIVQIFIPVFMTLVLMVFVGITGNRGPVTILLSAAVLFIIGGLICSFIYSIMKRQEKDDARKKALL